MKFQSALLTNAVNYRIGSLENTSFLHPQKATVNYRIGSLENLGTKRMANQTVNYRIGSLER